MVVHELMTNAVKHGALSSAGGRVLISSARLDSEHVRLEWHELTSAPVATPTRSGFGSMLLERAMGDRGQVSLDFRPGGLVCLIDLVASDVTLDLEVPASAAAPARRIKIDLRGARVLVLEDEPLISMSYESMLAKWEVEVVGPFTSCAQALAAIGASDRPVDVAILDVNLGKESSDAVASRLQQIGVPFLFTTGYGGDAGLETRYAGVQVLTKPAMPEDLELALKQLLADARVAEPVC